MSVNEFSGLCLLELEQSISTDSSSAAPPFALKKAFLASSPSVTMYRITNETLSKTCIPPNSLLVLVRFQKYEQDNQVSYLLRSLSIEHICNCRIKLFLELPKILLIVYCAYDHDLSDARYSKTRLVSEVLGWSWQ